MINYTKEDVKRLVKKALSVATDQPFTSCGEFFGSMDMDHFLVAVVGPDGRYKLANNNKEVLEEGLVSDLVLEVEGN